ncbi:hypothetical protein chiPu_0032574 [Chiloscyllium punctatum]|uniref:Uncharacterized protein n=1 Tax=Chiloscyllium punctatum TaxID=137246 RepID=A0A401U168_CHIPU|nr:hypothetical protein [Chiloscyllium punctatum]
MAESRDPVLAVQRRRAEHGFGKAGSGESLELEVAADLLDAEIERINLMGVDQDGRNPGTAEHGGCGRARKTSADDRDVGVSHERFRGRRSRFLRC